MLWLLIWRFGPEENDGCQSDQSHKTQTPFLSTEHSSCICAWHVGAVGVFLAYGYLQLPGGPALQPLVTGLGMVSFYFGASSGLLACSVATVLDWRRRRQLSAAGFWGGSCSHPSVFGSSLSTTLESAFEEFHSIPSSKGLKFDMFLLSLAGKTSILVTAFRPVCRPLKSIHSISITVGTSLVVQWLRLHAPDAGGLGSIPVQGTRSHNLQLRVHMPQLKILHSAMKIQDPECYN